MKTNPNIANQRNKFSINKIKKIKKENSHLMKSIDGAYRGYDKPQSASSKQPVIKAEIGEDESR